MKGEINNMNETELKNIYGGVAFSQGILNALVKGVSTIYDIGRRIGSTISRLKNGTVCR